MKDRQSRRIREIKDALITAGYISLDQQAGVLGLCRSSAWTLLRGNHKASGLSAATINRILNMSSLGDVRAKVLEYLEEKAAGHYGHSKRQRQRFIARLNPDAAIDVAHLRDLVEAKR